jgi:hypothetical protein
VSVTGGATSQVTGTFTSTPTPTPGPAPHPTSLGLLRVSTTPAVASRVVVDGLPRADWALTWVDAVSGLHDVCFTDVVGFVTPPCQSTSVPLGGTGTVTGQFTQLGLLQVAVAPAGLPVDVLVNGEPQNQFGAFAFTAAGSYEVCGTAIAGWTTPACAVVTVTSGALAPVTLTYVAVP